MCLKESKHGINFIDSDGGNGYIKIKKIHAD